jgi:RNA polymerase sigma factor (sigma-70 family)
MILDRHGNRQPENAETDMPDPSQMISTQTTPPRLRPLQTPGRTREATVEAQISRYLHSPAALLWRHAAVRDHHDANWVQEETLVALLRVWHAEGDATLVDRALEILLARSAAKIARQVNCWRIPPQHVEDCVSEIQTQMIEALLSPERGHEFWEVRFWVCLERRIHTTARRYRSQADPIVSLDPIEDSEGHETARLDQIAADCPVSPHQWAEYHEALSLLTERERCAFVLFRGEQWKQSEIAELLGVTDKTVRNLLHRAAERLKHWSGDDGG